MSGELRAEKEQSVLVVSGIFQGRNAADVRNKLIESVMKGHHNIVVDLAAVSAINATGLGVLVSVQQRLETLGGKLSLRGVNNSLKQVFERTRLHKTFGI